MSMAKATHALLTPSDVDEITSRIAETFARDTHDPSVCVADGYGVRVTVDGRHLVVTDGFGPQRRVRRYAKATHGLHRVVVIGASGMVSIEALRWCAGTGVQVVVLDGSDGSVLTTSAAPVTDDARIRRVQALAMGTDTGLELARYLITTKLAGQRQLAGGALGQVEVADTVGSVVDMLADAESLEEIRQLEATAANVYWSAWESVELHFTRRDAARTPDGWKRFTGRRSAVNPGSARSATSAITAMQNLSYRLLEAECRLATLTVALDPGLGVLHADMRARDGFVLDLMEACRPLADAHLLRLIQGTTFRRLDFGEDARGVVRVLPPLSHRLAEWMPHYATAIAPVVEKVREMLAVASPYDVSTPSYLTGVKHKEAARRRASTASSGQSNTGSGPGVVGLHPRGTRRQKPKAEATPRLPLPVCEMCGGRLEAESDRKGTRSQYCNSCRPARRVEIGTAIQKIPVERRGSRESAARRSAANSEHRLAQQRWELDHEGETFDREWYLREVLPRLRGVSLTVIATATGMSTSAASKIRSGKRVPHPRWWVQLHAVGSPDA